LLEAAQIVMTKLRQYPINYSGEGIGEVVEMEENPRPTRRVTTAVELQKGQLGSMSIGMLFRIRDVMTTHKPTTYQPSKPDADNPVYYILPGEIPSSPGDPPSGYGVLITDNLIDSNRKLKMIVPYAYYKRVEDIIKNIEDYVKYKGETKELTARFLYHKLYPEAEPQIYTTRPPTEKSEIVGLSPTGTTGGVTFVEGWGYTPWLEKYGAKEFGPRVKIIRSAYWWLSEHGIPIDPKEFEIKPPHEPSAVEKRTVLWTEGENLAGIYRSRDAGMKPFIQRGMINTIVGWKTIGTDDKGFPIKEEVYGMRPNMKWGPSVKYPQQAIEWLVAEGITPAAEPIAMEVRFGPDDTWEKTERIPGEEIPTTITPLWDESMGPIPVRHRREKTPPTTIIPLNEGNPLGAIGAAIVTGLAAGAASGATFGAMSAVGKAAEENKGKEKKE